MVQILGEPARSMSELGGPQGTVSTVVDPAAPLVFRLHAAVWCDYTAR